MRYFAYGSNLLHQRMRERTPSARFLVPARLKGYELCFHKVGTDGSGKADAHRTDQSSHQVWGVVYELPIAEKPILDNIEAPGRGYREASVELITDAGPLTAFAYLAMEEYRDSAMIPFHWYKWLVLAGAVQNGLPKSYIERIRAHESQPDPDEARAALEHEVFHRAGLGDMNSLLS